MVLLLLLLQHGRAEKMKTDLFTQDHYRVLGVARDANHGAIRKAYLKLVKQHHPDVSKGAQSEERFKAIASAWEASRLPLADTYLLLSLIPCGFSGCAFLHEFEKRPLQ